MHSANVDLKADEIRPRDRRGEDRRSGDRMRILMVAARYFPFTGGTETHIHEVSRRIVAAGHSVDILTADPTGELPREETVANVRILRVPAWPKASDLYFAPGVISAIGAGDWDLVHVQGYHTFVAPSAMLAGIRKRVPFAVTFHSGGHSSRLRNAIRGAQRAALRPLVKRASLLIGVSRFEADFFSSSMGIARSRFKVIPNGAQLPPPSTTPGAIPEGRLVLSIGRLERYKGHQRAIEAFPKVLQRFPDAHLMIVGQGPYEAQLRALISKYALANHVTIESIPPENRGRLTSLLSMASLVVLLSDYEAHPVAVVEALSAGRRVLVNNATGLKEIADDGLATAVEPHAGAADVARAIIGELGAGGIVERTMLPTWDDCAEQLIASYREMLAPGRTDFSRS
jgi:glycosyltransferase involved in cell wall biosynthesis